MFPTKFVANNAQYNTYIYLNSYYLIKATRTKSITYKKLKKYFIDHLAQIYTRFVYIFE